MRDSRLVTRDSFINLHLLPTFLSCSNIAHVTTLRRDNGRHAPVQIARAEFHTMHLRLTPGSRALGRRRFIGQLFGFQRVTSGVLSGHVAVTFP